MHDFIWRLQGSDTGPLDFGFQPELFAEESSPPDPAPAPSGHVAAELVYGPGDRLAFPAFRLSEAGRRATQQMTGCVETIAAFARDRGEADIADSVLKLNSIILPDIDGRIREAAYMPDLYTRGKHALEQIVAMLSASKKPEPGNDRRERDALQCLRLLGEGFRVCGARTLAELIDAESRLSQLGDGLKNSAQRVCRNTAETAVMRTLSKHGSVAESYLVNPHNRLQLDQRIGLPWAHAPSRDPYFRAPIDFELRARECRRAVRRSVTPAAVARVLARECLHEVRSSLSAWTGETQDLDGADWPTLEHLVAKAGQRFGPLRERSFVHGDGVLAPVAMRDDEQAVRSDIRKNLVTAGLAKERDRTVRQDNGHGSRWTLVLKQSEWPLVIEEDERGRQERPPLPADFLRALQLSSSGLERELERGDEFAWLLADPSALAEVVEGAVADRDTPPGTWETALLAAPGVLTHVCDELDNEAATQLLREMAGRSDAAESGLGGAVLATALGRKLPAATSTALNAMNAADLRANWPGMLPALQAALLAGDDALADAGLVALDRLMPAGDLPRWHACRRGLHEFRVGVKPPCIQTSPLPWPRDVSTRLGLLHREGLLPGPVIVALLRADARLGEALDVSRLHSDAECLHRPLAYMAQIGDDLALSPDDMRALLRPIAAPNNAPNREMGDRAGTSPLCSAVMQGHPTHVTAFLAWMTTHASAPWMPPLQALALPDEVLVPHTNTPAMVAQAFKAYLEGLTTLQRQGCIDDAALAPLLQAGSAGSAEIPGGLPSGPGMALVRKALALDDTRMSCAEVLTDWREDHARRTVASSAVSTGGAPATARAAPKPDRVAALTRGLDRAVPWSQQLPLDLLEAHLIHHGMHGYLGVDALVEKIKSAWRSFSNPTGQFDNEQGFRLLKRLASCGVLAPPLCIELATRCSGWEPTRSLIDTLDVSLLRLYLDLLEHLAEVGPCLFDLDYHLHFFKDDRWMSLSSHCLRQPGDMFNVFLDGALEARRRRRITSEQLTKHLCAWNPLTNAPALTTLLVRDGNSAAASVDAAQATRRARGDALLKQWLNRLLLAEQDRCLSPTEVVELLTKLDADDTTPLFFAMWTGMAERLPLLFDWLVLATEGRPSVLTRRLVSILQGDHLRSAAFEALRWGHVDALDTWLTGIRQLRERQCLSNAEYVTLLVPNDAGDQHAIQEAAARGDDRARACAARLRLAAEQGQALGWIADDELREILDPLDWPGLSA